MFSAFQRETLWSISIKNLTTAEGGAVSSIHPELLLKARRFSRQGLIRNKDEFQIKTEGAWHQEVHDFGLNYRLPDVLCALGISQIARIEQFKHSRAKLFKKYCERLMHVEKLELPSTRQYVEPMWHLFPIHVEPSERGRIFEQLRMTNIGAQVNYMPAHWHPAFKQPQAFRNKFPASNEFYSSEISLPMHTEITDEDFEFIIENLGVTIA